MWANYIHQWFQGGCPDTLDSPPVSASAYTAANLIRICLIGHLLNMHGHIFCYFVDRIGVYTRQQMLQWKQLDAYNYFTSGFVCTVDLRNTSECMCDTEGSREPKHEKSRKCSQGLGSDQEIWRYSGSPLGEGGGRVTR